MPFEHQAAKTRDDHLTGPGPKRILSLDGGGVRALVALAFLERIEELLRECRNGDASFRLADHFDLIGGTSSGAMLAAGLALGRSVGEIMGFARRLAQRTFINPHWSRGLLSPKFSSKPFLEELRRIVGDETLGSPRIRTGLAIVAKRLDTASPWVFHNNPRGRYYNGITGGRSRANRDLPLHEILHASAAAPTYFEPERISVADGVDGLFVDGGISPYNNPALLLFLMATTSSYGYAWPAGENQLSLISVGTGSGGPLRRSEALERLPSALLAAVSLESIMADCNWQAQGVLQWLGACSEPWPIDAEAGDCNEHGALPMRLLHYQRYNLLFDPDWFNSELGIATTVEEIAHFSRLDGAEAAEQLLELARRAAARQVKIEHVLPESMAA